MRLMPVRGVLLDIEGTTTPIAFVYDVLFPFARLDRPFLGRLVRVERRVRNLHRLALVEVLFSRRHRLRRLRPAPQQAEDQKDHRDDEHEMDERARDVESEKPQEPENEQDHEDRPEHVASFSPAILPRQPGSLAKPLCENRAIRNLGTWNLESGI